MSDKLTPAEKTAKTMKEHGLVDRRLDDPAWVAERMRNQSRFVRNITAIPCDGDQSLILWSEEYEAAASIIEAQAKELQTTKAISDRTILNDARELGEAFSKIAKLKTELRQCREYVRLGMPEEVIICVGYALGDS